MNKIKCNGVGDYNGFFECNTNNNEIELMDKELSGSEAIYGFCGWLTTRKEKTIMSSSDDCAVIVDLIEDYCKINNLKEPVDGWEKRLKYPK